jgi:hypothetical protein
MSLSDLHYNGSGIYCNAHVEIDSIPRHEWIKTRCHSKSIDHSTVSLPKVKMYCRRNDNVLLGLALLSFDCMSRVILFFGDINLIEKTLYHIYDLDNT